jgi:curved DNA-binding protein
MAHHPDRTGGDDSKFKEINEAYQNLSDPQKKQMYDQFGTADPRQHQYRSGDFEFNFNGNQFGGFEDIFAEMFGGRGPFGQRVQRNRPMNIAVDVSLEDIKFGKTIGIEIRQQDGSTKVVTVDVPQGIEHGQQIRYANMGDQSIRQAPAGDLIVTIRVRKHPTYERFGDNIVCEKQINVLELMIGTKTNIKTLDGKNLDINIPAGTQIGTMLSCKGEGLPNINTKKHGNLLVRILGIIPKNLSQDQLNKIKDINNGL